MAAGGGAGRTGAPGWIGGIAAGVVVIGAGLYVLGIFTPAPEDPAPVAEQPAPPDNAPLAESPAPQSAPPTSSDAATGSGAQVPVAADSAAPPEGEERAEAAAPTPGETAASQAGDRAASPEAGAGGAKPDIPASEATETAALSRSDPSPDVAAEAADSPDAPDVLAPSFDLVRVEPDGTAIIAGKGLAGSRVALLVDRAEHESLEIDRTGSFVFFAQLPPSPAPRVLSLRAGSGADAVLSPDEIILAPTQVTEVAPDPAPVKNAAPEPAPAPDAAPAPGPLLAGTAPETPDAPDSAVPDPQARPERAEPRPETGAPSDVVVAATTPSAEAPQPALPEEGDPAVVPQVAARAPQEASPALPTAATDPAAVDVDPEPAPAATGPARPVTPAGTVPPETVASASRAETPVAPVAEPAARTDTGADAGEGKDAADGPDPATDTRPAAAPETQPAPPPQPQAPSATAEAPAQNQVPAAGADPAPVAVIRSGADGVELVQPAASVPAGMRETLTLETIGYSATGQVQLSGRTRPGAVVRIYLDNAAVADFASSEDGRWKGGLTGIAPGIYTLRLDALDPSGDVLGRVETPFKREAPEQLQTQTARAAGRDPQTGAPLQDAPPIRAVTVQKGDTLWAISRERYGEPLLYVKVFEANRDQIRDPDLIYPGQVFAMPDAAE